MRDGGLGCCHISNHFVMSISSPADSLRGLRPLRPITFQYNIFKPRQVLSQKTALMPAIIARGMPGRKPAGLALARYVLLKTLVRLAKKEM